MTAQTTIEHYRLPFPRLKYINVRIFSKLAKINVFYVNNCQDVIFTASHQYLTTIKAKFILFTPTY
jgi:hypothetical protein